MGRSVTRKNAIGIHEVINTATPEKMMIIKNKYYFPNNSMLVICGDVKHEDAFAKAKKYFRQLGTQRFRSHLEISDSGIPTSQIN